MDGLDWQRNCQYILIWWSWNAVLDSVSINYLWILIETDAWLGKDNSLPSKCKKEKKAQYAWSPSAAVLPHVVFLRMQLMHSDSTVVSRYQKVTDVINLSCVKGHCSPHAHLLLFYRFRKDLEMSEVPQCVVTVYIDIDIDI